MEINLFKRYFEIKAEMEMVEAKLSKEKKELDRMNYSGCRDVKARDYSSETRGSGNEESTENFFARRAEQVEKVRALKEEYDMMHALLVQVSKVMKTYSERRKEDLDAKVFIEHIINGKKLNQILILNRKTGDYYSYHHIKLTWKKIKENLKNV